ncbi:AAA family ATPase [Thermodesulfovibrio sp. 3907-1M]|uniref:AAA family ATPase n=1 Tax=Thermodesulfovibrio autotrophicus TaxID=3118333 RepID=A0AAU8GTG9_9BACT
MIKIKRILIENVGIYRQREFIFEHPCCLIVDRNEAGKSLLANSILEALYPLKSSHLLNNGNITIEIESENDFYQIIRGSNGYRILKNGNPLKFETKNKGRIVKKSPGEIIFNLSREVFINTSFLTQKAGVNTKELYSITSFLERAIDTGFQDTSASVALAKIKEALHESIHAGSLFPFATKGKLDTAIKSWKEKLAQYQEKKSHLKSLTELQADIIEKYAQTMHELEKINNKLTKIESNYATWKIQRDNLYRRELEKLERRNQELKEFEKLVDFYKNFENLKSEEQQFIILYENEIQTLLQSLKSKQQRQKEIKILSKKLYLLVLIIALLSIIAGFINKIFYSGILLSIPLLFYQLKLYSENKKLTNEIKELQLKNTSLSEHAQQLISKFSINDASEFFSIFKKMNMHKAEIKEFIENAKKTEDYKKNLLSEEEIKFYESRILTDGEINYEDIEKYEQKKDELLRTKEELKDKIHQLQRDYEKIIQRRKEIEELDEKIEASEKYLKTLERFKKALQKSFEVIETITEKHHEVWAERLNVSASELLSKITGKTVNISFSKDLSFNIKVPEIEYDLSEKEIETKLSGGMVEQIYLTVRLILAQALSKNIKIPLILDEPFAHSDDERFIRGMKYLIQEIAKSNQVIILSCHQNRLNLLKELEGDFKLISVNT